MQFIPFIPFQKDSNKKNKNIAIVSRKYYPSNLISDKVLQACNPITIIRQSY